MAPLMPQPIHSSGGREGTSENLRDGFARSIHRGSSARSSLGFSQFCLRDAAPPFPRTTICGKVTSFSNRCHTAPWSTRLKGCRARPIPMRNCGPEQGPMGGHRSDRPRSRDQRSQAGSPKTRGMVRRLPAESRPLGQDSRDFDGSAKISRTALTISTTALTTSASTARS